MNLVRRPRVLLVEPDEIWFDLLLGEIRTAVDGSDVEISSSRSWSDALSQIRDSDFDLLVTDLVGQGSEGNGRFGFRLVEAAGADVKAIVLSGPGAGDWEVGDFLAKNGGRVKYIRKAVTYRADDFRAQVRAMLFDEDVEQMPPTRELFLSYAHADGDWLDRFTTVFRPLQDRANITPWSDQDVMPGSRWKSEISNAIERMYAAVLLVTPNFLASEFIMKSELPMLLTSPAASEQRIYWVAVEHCLWSETDLAQLQAVNDAQRPIGSLEPREQGAELARIASRLGEFIR